MRHLLDLGFWLVPPGPDDVQQGDNPPVAVDDTLSVPRTAGPTKVAVLANDVDPEGQPLTLVSAYAGLGTAVANPDNTVSYTPPAGIPAGQVEFDTVVYEIADVLDQRDTGQINVTIEGPDLQVNVTPQNTLVVIADTTPVDLTVTDPSVFAGSYSFNVADLAAGPVNLVPPAIAGTVAVGQMLNALDGFWAYDTSAGPVNQSWQWQRGGVDIAGATGASYTMQAADDGPGLSVVETLSDAHGVRSAASAAVAQGFSPAVDSALIAWWDAADAATITQSGGTLSAWTDKAGGAAIQQITGFRQPGTGSRTLGGLNVLDFDGVDDQLIRAMILPASGDVAVHMVLEIDSVGSAFAAILSFEATNDMQIDANAAGQFDGRLNTTGIATPVSLSGGPYVGPVILSAIFDFTGGTAEVFLGGVSRGSTAYTTKLDASTALHLMTNRSQNAWINGAIAEIVVTGSVANRAEHHAYLASKWGLS